MIHLLFYPGPYRFYYIESRGYRQMNDTYTIPPRTLSVLLSWSRGYRPMYDTLMVLPRTLSVTSYLGHVDIGLCMIHLLFYQGPYRFYYLGHVDIGLCMIHVLFYQGPYRFYYLGHVDIGLCMILLMFYRWTLSVLLSWYTPWI